MWLILLLGLQLAIVCLRAGVHRRLTTITTTYTVAIHGATNFLPPLRRVLFEKVLLGGARCTLGILQTRRWNRSTRTNHLLLLDLGGGLHERTWIGSFGRAAASLSCITACHVTGPTALSWIEHLSSEFGLIDPFLCKVSKLLKLVINDDFLKNPSKRTYNRTIYRRIRKRKII